MRERVAYCDIERLRFGGSSHRPLLLNYSLGNAIIRHKGLSFASALWKPVILIAAARYPFLSSPCLTTSLALHSPFSFSHIFHQCFSSLCSLYLFHSSFNSCSEQLTATLFFSFTPTIPELRIPLSYNPAVLCATILDTFLVFLFFYFMSMQLTSDHEKFVPFSCKWQLQANPTDTLEAIQI